MGREKRKFQRLPLRGFLECNATIETDKDTITQVPVISISAGGVYLVILNGDSYGLDVGDIISSIQINHQALEQIRPSGEVVHKMPIGGVQGFGVHFLNMGKDQEALLNGWVHQKLEEFGLG